MRSADENEIPWDTTELPRFPRRALDSHKGDFGRVLVIGGARGMAGAAGLAGMAALRSGAGLVEVAVPNVCQNVVAAYEPSYLTRGIPEGASLEEAQAALEPALRAATVVACGPGLGRAAPFSELALWLFETLEKPLVVDADGLNALATRREQMPKHRGPRVITPHPGEFARLTDQPAATDDDQRIADAARLADSAKLIVVLKGHRTIVSDGSQGYVNLTGNPGMATGGTGDVLTGLLAGFWAQGLDAYQAARLAVFLHGRAGDLAATQLGQLSLVASDLLKYLPSAVHRHQQW